VRAALELADSKIGSLIELPLLSNFSRIRLSIQLLQRQTMGSIRQMVALSWALAGSLTGVASAQVGLSSGLARVTLTARVASRGSIESVASIREQGRQGVMCDVSVVVRLSANAPYRLIVQRSQAGGDRTGQIWVCAADGGFQPLDADAGIVVARESLGTGSSERQVYFRVEWADTLSGPVNALPVRYEIAIDPTQ
jgi:hypothetical protein